MISKLSDEELNKLYHQIITERNYRFYMNAIRKMIGKK